MTTTHDDYMTHVALDILYDEDWQTVSKNIHQAIVNSELDTQDDDVRVVAKLDEETLIMFFPPDEVNDHAYWTIECRQTGDVFSTGKLFGWRSAVFLYEDKCA